MASLTLRCGKSGQGLGSVRMETVPTQPLKGPVLPRLLAPAQEGPPAVVAPPQRALSLSSTHTPWSFPSSARTAAWAAPALWGFNRALTEPPTAAWEASTGSTNHMVQGAHPPWSECVDTGGMPRGNNACGEDPEGPQKALRGRSPPYLSHTNSTQAWYRSMASPRD